MPVIIRMSGFRIKKDEGPWTSDPFYSHSGGHKLRLTMNVVKSSDWFSNRFSHFSLSLLAIYDAHKRRFKQCTIKISLLNQCGDNGHHTSVMNVWVPNLERDIQVGKIDQFISYEDFYRSTKTCQFLQNNSIFIKLQWVEVFMLGEDIVFKTKVINPAKLFYLHLCCSYQSYQDITNVCVHIRMCVHIYIHTYVTGFAKRSLIHAQFQHTLLTTNRWPHQ